MEANEKIDPVWRLVRKLIFCGVLGGKLETSGRIYNISNTAVSGWVVDMVVTGRGLRQWKYIVVDETEDDQTFCQVNI